MGLVTAATTSILFSSLSRLQTDENAFQSLFFKFQKLVGILVIPLGVGMFCYSDLITEILLGSQWMEASGFVGLWGLTSAITIILSHYSSEVYRSKGRPKLSVLAQWLHIVALWPTVIIAAKYGFEVLYTARALVRLELILVNLIIMYVVVRISPWKMIKNISASCISALFMLLAAFALSLCGTTLWWQLFSVVVCIFVYFGILFSFPKERKCLLAYLTRFISRL
jgi:PST family polysaccharide transporter